MAKSPRTDKTDRAADEAEGTAAPQSAETDGSEDAPEDTGQTVPPDTPPEADTPAPATSLHAPVHDPRTEPLHPGPATPDPAPDNVPDPAPEPVDAAADTPPLAEALPAPAAPPPAAPQQGRTLPLVLGGVIAAVLGAAALWYTETQGWTALGGPDAELLARIDSLDSDLAAAQDALAGAEDRIAALEDREPDLSEVNAAIDSVRETAEATRSDLAALSDRVDTLTARLDDTDDRLNTVAVQQIPEAELPQAISEAYDEKLADLLATIDGRFGTMREELDAKLAELEASQTAAAEAEAAAQRAAQMAEARAAMGQVEQALSTGAAYSEPLAEVADLSGADIPALLQAGAEDGIPTLDELQESFPDHAREALTLSARAAAEEGELSTWEAFLRSQVGARSLAPREGDDPDAVLSRVEAAVSRGDLDTALTEIEALPPVGQEAMADWVALAETRRDTLAAARDLAAQLNPSEDG
ncbi:hypothetical protein P1J78_16555 [Psychromarinibacter sp. C21-152]|uniref:Mitochondrial inner membrane protein n=1 Tax=Psychromarinibacter sediminicola TaxID=3033385 RepID=A0AAE3NUI6_9RHOB|nr:hypothetical protein [Psychromarinibacter sediminicola]MDF0602352.1 hypothetical protein [Psychromarinibacter sediminicola]